MELWILPYTCDFSLSSFSVSTVSSFTVFFLLSFLLLGEFALLSIIAWFYTGFFHKVQGFSRKEGTFKNPKFVRRWFHKIIFNSNNAEQKERTLENQGIQSSKSLEGKVRKFSKVRKVTLKVLIPGKVSSHSNFQIIR